jgi:hypothetical protein
VADMGRLANLPDQQLEQALADLGRLIEFPRTPDFASAIRSRLEAEPAPREIEPDNLRFFTPRRMLAIAAAVLLLFLGAALAGLPDFRHAVADRLGVRGIKITFEDETPTPSSSPVGPSLVLGNRTTLDEAKDTVPFVLRGPTLPGVGDPDEVYLRTLPDGQPMVSFLYYPSGTLPETAETGAGALLMQFQTDTETPMMAKEISKGGDLIEVFIGDDVGFFVTGPSNFILSLDPSQIDCCDPTYSRPSGNVLVWEHNGVTYRLESWLDAVEAVEFAESLEPVP